MTGNGQTGNGQTGNSQTGNGQTGGGQRGNGQRGNGQTGYVPHFRQLLAGLGVDAIQAAPHGTTVDGEFLDFLLAEFARLLAFDDAFYAAANPDVAALIAQGLYRDFHDHFVRAGYREGRLPHRLAFDAPTYAAGYPELRELSAQGGAVGLAAHFLQFGRFEGRSAHPQTDADAARWARAAARSRHELAHRTLSNALVQAFLPPVLGPVGRGFRGGPVLGEAPEDLALRHCRGGRAIDSFPPRDEWVGTLDGEFVYGGPYCDHFGHSMAEMIHRVLPARALFDCNRLLFVGLGRGQPPAGWDTLPPVMQAPLEFLQVDPACVSVIHDNRVVHRLHIVQQGSDLSGGPRPAYLRMLAQFTPARLEELHDGHPAAERLYVSRSRIIHGGLLLGERYLEQALQAEGWTVLHPQDLPLVGQMQAYHRARQLLFAEGSACHGAELFGTGGLAHCVLLPRREASLHVFENTLRPRAQRFDVLPSATLLGGILKDGRTGAAMENLGVSVLDMPALVAAMRALGLAELGGMTLAAYRRAAQADLAAHIAHHRREGTPLVDDAAITALQVRLTASLRPPR